MRRHTSAAPVQGRCVAACGINALWLRRSHATHSLARGLPLEIVREVLGHAPLSTTSRYVRPERGD